MGTFYLDIETTGLDEVTDKIISIQYQELERGTGKPIGDLHILKEWELGEDEILQKFIVDSPIVSSYPFDFIPVGYNLNFEHKFFLERCAQYNKFPISILSRPCIDLRPIGVLMNSGEFKDSGLDKLTGKKHSGSPIPQWYENQQYDLITDYINKETQEFAKFYSWLHIELPLLRQKLLQPTNS